MKTPQQCLDRFCDDGIAYGLTESRAIRAIEFYHNQFNRETMNLKNEFQPIREWAKAKGILDHGDKKTQTIKLMEEVGELSHALLRDDQEEFIDAIGDIVVVLTSLAHHAGVQIEHCINKAYTVIKDRQGKIQEGNFVKD